MSALTTVLLNLFLIYAAAKVAGALIARFGQPAVIGEILAGVLIGPYALGLVGEPSSGILDLFNGDHEAAEHALDLVLESIAELGVVVLLFTVGLETRATDLLKVGGRAVAVGVCGIIVPFVLGFGFMLATDHPHLESAFVATALVATSVGITARVLQELGVLRTREARIILGAAVIDDVLGLLLLSIVNSAGSEGDDAQSIILVALLSVAFVGFVAWAGTHATRRFSVRLEDVAEVVPLNVSLFLMLGLAALASVIGLAGIIGAFLAGMVLAESRERFNLEEQARPIAELLVPIFFVYTGTKVDPSAFLDGTIVMLAVAITLIALVSKLIGAGGAMWGTGRRSMLIVGTGMAPRGEVGLIVAGIGLNNGIIPVDIFSVVVIMSVATTLVVPPALTAIYRRSPEIGASSVITHDVSDEFDSERDERDGGGPGDSNHASYTARNRDAFDTNPTSASSEER
jgi:Kef-type K+ transport system membrane component KefB